MQLIQLINNITKYLNALNAKGALETSDSCERMNQTITRVQQNSYIFLFKTDDLE
ncbi:hypothetical protein [Acinetobacter silvestris]|uniref:hypothetical protein n=1 Tax=Acinetobacter silvestris TaxID=1977882 RepID=UPI00148A734F|nr:hypothetical protein [Acinetobacter silvestris]